MTPNAGTFVWFRARLRAMANLRHVCLPVVGVLAALTACASSDGANLSRCDDGTQRYDCTDAWQTDLAVFLNMGDPAEIMGTAEQGDTRTTQEQLNAAAAFQRFALATSRAEQACQMRQDVPVQGDPLNIPAEIEAWVTKNLCP